ncbi:MAG: chromosome segregation protein SMC [Defluviitaleaceae bacterium]|nr:chromosome segregation protein SMC [Defluviitaleaceae bacterium]
MHLKRLELHGFKSFYEKTVIEFAPGVTAVVGPNGSGKSNVADAIRWTLGEQSVKQLRGRKMEDVIFSGTENRRGMAFAEVTLVLDNACGSFNKSGMEYGSEIAVSRRLYRSGESNYLINAKNVRLKDVHELFMDTGLGREGYSIIGQGRIDDILSAKSEDRRALFEEAAGIIKYRTRRDEAVSKLAREEQSLVRVSDIITEIEGSLEPMAEQAEKARRFIALSDELKRVKISIYVLFLQGFEEQKDRANDDINGVKKALADAEGKRGEQQNEAEKLREQLEFLNNEIQRFYDERNDVQLAIAGFDNEIKIREMQIEHIDEAKKRNISDAEARRAAAKGFDDERTMSTQRAVSLKQEITEKTGTGGKIKLDINRSEEEIAEREREIEEFNAKHIEILSGLTDAKTRIEGLLTAYDELENRKESLVEELAALAEELAEYSGKQTDAEETLQTLASDGEKCKEDIARYTEIRDAINAEYTELKNIYRAEAAALLEYRQRFKVLSELEASHDGYQHAVKTILNARSSGKLSGIIGAVGDLISTEKNYETAVEVALGGAITDIVVDDENAAKRAIEYLKTNKSGRATFLPLTAVKGRDFGADKVRLLAEPGIVGVAADFVSADAKYIAIIGNFLGRILIAKDFDAAISLSRKYGYKHRVVTLAGEDIKAGGAITGGSQDRRSGILSRKREIVELAGEIKTSEVSAEKRNEELDELNAKVTGTSEVLERAKMSLHELELRRVTQTSMLAQIKAVAAAAQKRVAELEKQDISIMQKLTEINGNIRIQREAEAAARAGTDELLSEMSLRQAALSAGKKVRDELNKSYNALLVEISSLSELVRQLEKAAERADEAASDARNEAKNLINMMQELDEELVKRYGEIDEAKKQRVQKILEKDGFEADSEELRNKRAGAERELRDKVEAEQEAFRLKTRLEAELDRVRIRKDSLESEAERHHNEMWEEYEVTPKLATDIFNADDEMKVRPPNKLRQDENRLRGELRAMGGTVNVSAAEDYRLLLERHTFMAKQRDDVYAAMEQLGELRDMLNKQMETLFVEQFTQIKENFKAVFAEMFGGGSGMLELTEPGNALTSGIEIIARPPGKVLQNMNLLSGGERALCAIALLFAILRLKPSPFCVLDEIETALDDANVRRFARFMKGYNENGEQMYSSQFIIITHRKGTMEAADVLHGITMQEVGVSKLVSVNMQDYGDREVS